MRISERRHTDTHNLFVILLIVLMLITCFSSNVNADTGAKPSVRIKVLNPPEQDYYIAMLWDAPDVPHREYTPDDSLSDEENALVASIFEYEEDGYKLFSNFKDHYFRSNGDDSYLFYGYAGVLPGSYKIMIVTLDGQVQVSERIDQKAFNSSLVYDYSSNTFEEQVMRSLFGPCLICAVVFLAVTLFAEWIVLCGFGLINKKNIRTFILINVVTQLILNVFNICWYLSDHSGFYTVPWIVAEILIIVIEALWYKERLINKEGKISVKRNITYAIVANVVSILADLPVYLILLFIPITRSGLW